MEAKAEWFKGIVEWTEGDQAFVSVVFTWDMPRAWQRAMWLHHAGYQVSVGGPAVHAKTPHREALREIATIGGSLPDVVASHNPQATFASRGCPVGCWFCIVPSMEGRDFTLIEDFPVRPILCDNNLSALPADFQDHIVSRYRETGVPLLDANSGFEPRTFDEEVFARWKPINRGPWRFALDDQGDVPHVLRVLEMLKDKVADRSRKRVYVLIGNEPFESCMERIQMVIDGGAEPYVQPVMKLNALEREPWLIDLYGWTRQELVDVARWVNGWVWRDCSFEDYDRSLKKTPREEHEVENGWLFNDW